MRSRRQQEGRDPHPSVMKPEKKVLPDDDAPEETVVDKILDAVITGVPDDKPKTEEQEKYDREVRRGH